MPCHMLRLAVILLRVLLISIHFLALLTHKRLIVEQIVFSAVVFFAPVRIAFIELIRDSHFVIVFVIGRLVDFIRIHVVLVRRATTLALLNIVVDPFIRRRPAIRVIFHFIEELLLFLPLVPLVILLPISLTSVSAHEGEKLVSFVVRW